MKKQNKHQKDHQSSLRQIKFSAAGSTFSIDIDGQVHSSKLGCIGHEEDVLNEGQVFWELIESLKNVVRKT